MRDSAEEIAKGPSEWAMRVADEQFDLLGFIAPIAEEARATGDVKRIALVLDREFKALREAVLEEAANSICPSTPWDSEMQSYAEGFAEMIRALKEPKP